MLFILDNYDSFVHNLARYFRRLGQETHIVRNDRIDAAGVRELRARAIVISPGPCGPEQAGCSLELVRRLAEEVPILGICLGHQVIAQALGGRIVRAPRPVHGRADQIHHDGRGLFAGLPSPLAAGRYHSLVAEEASLPRCLEVTARTDDGTIMAVAHRDLPVVGLQFHPESILTPLGYCLLAGFLRLAGLPTGDPPPAEAECSAESPAARRLPPQPVTF